MRDIALALFVFGMIPYILMRPFVGLLVWSWLGYMSPYRLCYGFAVTFPWVYVVAIVTLVSLALSRESKRIPVSALSILLFLFLVWTGITTIYAIERAAAWEEYQQFAKILVMVFVTLVLANGRQRMHWVVWMIVASIGFYGLKGGLFTLATGGGHHVFGPARSFIADNNDLAQALCMILPLIRYLQLQATKKWLRMGLGAFMVLTGIGILGTYSRGGLVALAVVGAALVLKSRRQITIALALVVIAFTAYQFMPAQWLARMNTLHHARQTESAETRIQSWEFATNVALHRPITGGGFEIYKSVQMWELYGPADAIPRAIHSIYFRVLGEQGFVGLALFLALLLTSWRCCGRVRKQTRGSPPQKWAYDLASMLQVSLAAYMTAGLATTSSYFDLSYQLMALCMLLPITVASRAATAGTPGGNVAATLQGGSDGEMRGRTGPRQHIA